MRDHPPAIGLDDADPRTLEDIGHRLVITRERVRQIEVEALKPSLPPPRDGGSGALGSEVGLDGPSEVAQLAQRAGLDLPNPLAG